MRTVISRNPSSDDLRGKVERLRAAREACEQQFQEKVASVNELDAENERLREANTSLRLSNDNLRSLLAQSAHGEVDRLRAALTLGQVMLDSLNDENEFNPDTVHAFAVALGEHEHQSFVDGCYPCDLIQRNNDLRAEVERLRAAITRAHTHFAPKPGCSLCELFVKGGA